MGRPPYNPAVIPKMLLLSYLYDLSERQIEMHVNDSLSAKYFLGQAIDEAAPDHSTLTAFKGRIVRRGGEGLLVEVVVETARRKGVVFGNIQVVRGLQHAHGGGCKRGQREAAPEEERQATTGRWGSLGRVKEAATGKARAGNE